VIRANLRGLAQGGRFALIESAEAGREKIGCVVSGKRYLRIDAGAKRLINLIDFAPKFPE